MKFNRLSIVKGLNGKPLMQSAEEVLTLQMVLVESLNAPPGAIALQPGSNPRHTAEIRGGVMQKVSGASDEFELLPAEVDEALYCVAALQPSTLYLGVKDILNNPLVPPPPVPVDEPAPTPEPRPQPGDETPKE